MPNNDSLKSAAAFIAFILAGLWAYFRPQRRPATQSPVLTGVGIELGNREQTERLVGEVHGCRVALEALADKRVDEMEDIHKALLECMDAQERREEQDEQRPRRWPACALGLDQRLETLKAYPVARRWEVKPLPGFRNPGKVQMVGSLNAGVTANTAEGIEKPVSKAGGRRLLPYRHRGPLCPHRRAKRQRRQSFRTAPGL